MGNSENNDRFCLYIVKLEPHGRRMRQVSSEELVQQYATFLWRYAALRLGASMEAEDVVAETFAAALSKLSRCPKPAPEGAADDPVRAWLVGIARRKIADTLRRRRRDSISVPQELACVDPAETVLTADSVQRLHGFLLSLPENYRDVLLMKYADDLSLKEIGRVLGKSPNAIGQLLHRARTTARERGNGEDWL